MIPKLRVALLLPLLAVVYFSPYSSGKIIPGKVVGEQGSGGRWIVLGKGENKMRIFVSSSWDFLLDTDDLPDGDTLSQAMAERRSDVTKDQKASKIITGQVGSQAGDKAGDKVATNSLALTDLSPTQVIPVTEIPVDVVSIDDLTPIYTETVQYSDTPLLTTDGGYGASTGIMPKDYAVAGTENPPDQSDSPGSSVTGHTIDENNGPTTNDLMSRINQVTSEEMANIKKMMSLLQKTRQDRTHGLLYLQGNDSNVSVGEEARDQTELQLHQDGVMFDSVNMTESKVKELEKKVRLSREASGVDESLPKEEFIASLRVATAPNGDSIPVVQDMKGELKKLVEREVHSEGQDSEDALRMARLLTFAHKNKFFVGISHPDAMMKPYGRAMLLDASLPVGYAALEAMAGFMAMVAVRRSEETNAEIFKEIIEMTKDFMAASSQRLNEKIFADLSDKEARDTLLSILVFLQLKEAGDPILQGLLEHYANPEHGYGAKYMELSRWKKLFTQSRMSLLPMFTAKGLLDMPVLGKPVDIFGGGNVSFNIKVDTQKTDAELDGADGPDEDGESDGDNEPLKERERRED